MGHYQRPIVGTTALGTGATYVILNRYVDTIRIATSVNGTVTDYDVDWTIDNIMFDTATLANAVNMQPNAERVDPTAAVWTATTINAASGSDALDMTQPTFAIRINIIAGTGSVTYRILQSD